MLRQGRVVRLHISGTHQNRAELQLSKLSINLIILADMYNREIYSNHKSWRYEWFILKIGCIDHR